MKANRLIKAIGVSVAVLVVVVATHWFAVLPTASAAPAKVVQYKVVMTQFVDVQGHDKRLEELLNARASEGWQFDGVITEQFGNGGTLNYLVFRKSP